MPEYLKVLIGMIEKMEKETFLSICGVIYDLLTKKKDDK